MVISSQLRPIAPWQAGHFIAGHPGLDFANTVFHRTQPVADNELLKTEADLIAWCQSAGLVSPAEARRLARRADMALVETVRRIRDNAWTAFGAMTEGDAPPPKALGGLLRLAGLGVSAGLVAFTDAQLSGVTGEWSEPEALPAALALLVLEAMFILPKDKMRACPRCGWFFVDSSKGGRRRWCSMSTCGNREKAARHRHGEAG